MLLHRIQQFYSALIAEVKADEIEFVRRYLNSLEQGLFFQMSVVDQRHALDATYIAIELAAMRQIKDDLLLTRAALLHDIGKKDGELTMLDRTLVVLFQRFWPRQMEAWALEGRGGFIRNRRHAFFIAVNHGMRGAMALEKIGCDAGVVRLVRDHHRPGIDDWRMSILQEADRRS